MADSIDDLQPGVINLTLEDPEDRKTMKTPRTSDGHRDVTDESRGESVGDVGSLSGTSDREEVVSVRGRQTQDAFHQQAEAEESQSEGHGIRDWLREIVNILDADEISINRICLKLQKKKSKDERGESVDDVGSSSGTSDRDNPDAFHQQAEAEGSQSEDQSKRELLREIIKRVEADKISMSYTLSNLEVNRVILLQFLTDIKKFKGLLNGQLEEQNAFDVTAPLINADGGDVDLQPAAEAEEGESEDHGNAVQNDIREELHQIVKRFHAQVHDRSYFTKLKEIRAIWLQILMELNELKGSPGAPVA